MYIYGDRGYGQSHTTTGRCSKCDAIKCLCEFPNHTRPECRQCRGIATSAPVQKFITEESQAFREVKEQQSKQIDMLKELKEGMAKLEELVRKMGVTSEKVEDVDDSIYDV